MRSWTTRNELDEGGRGLQRSQMEMPERIGGGWEQERLLRGPWDRKRGGPKGDQERLP
ncbi:MAG: hypothetical protein METHAR1v1_1570033 [Methanothrix sp.]|nr:MAG: hypothetical protein METHAR1v1_1570033 [Methanothrix sp.]